MVINYDLATIDELQSAIDSIEHFMIAKETIDNMDKESSLKSIQCTEIEPVVL